MWNGLKGKLCFALLCRRPSCNGPPPIFSPRFLLNVYTLVIQNRSTDCSVSIPCRRRSQSGRAGEHQADREAARAPSAQNPLLLLLLLPTRKPTFIYLALKRSILTVGSFKVGHHDFSAWAKVDGWVGRVCVLGGIQSPSAGLWQERTDFLSRKEREREREGFAIIRRALASGGPTDTHTAGICLHGKNGGEEDGPAQ